MNWIILIVGMTLVTFGVRYLPLALVSRMQLPPLAIKALRYVPVAVLTAITVPIMLMPAGTMELTFRNSYLVSGIVALLVAWRTRSLLLTIVIGMAFFLLWRQLI